MTKQTLLGFSLIAIPLIGYSSLVSLDAEEVIKTPRVVIAKKKATITYRGYQLTADEISFYPSKNLLVAKGHVKLKKDNEIDLTAGEVLFINLPQTGKVDKKKTKKGQKQNVLVAYDVRGKFQNFYLNVEYLEKRGNLLIAKRGCVSQCRDFDAQVCARSFVFNLQEGLGNARNVVVKIENTPVIYTPLYRIATKRRSGFLAPSFGLDSYGNFIYQQPFYWAIDNHSDATFTADLRSGGMYGIQTEFRKYFSSDFYIETRNHYYQDEAKNKYWWVGRDFYRRNRYLLQGEGYYGKLQFGWAYPSDPYYYYDIFFNKEQLKYLSFTQSYITYTWNTRYFLTNWRTVYFYDLTTTDRSNDLFLLPDGYFYLKPIPLKGGISFDLTSEATNFYRNNSSLWRFVFKPRFRFSKVFGTTPITFYVEPYLITYDGKDIWKNNLDKSASSVKFTARSLLYNFDLVKSEKFSWFSLWEWVYSYDPIKNKNLPIFDIQDEVFRQNMLTLRGLNDFNYKGRKFAQWLIEQPYNFYNGYTLPTSGELMKGHWLPLKSYLTLTPNDDWSLYNTIYYDHKLAKIIYQSTGASWRIIKTDDLQLRIKGGYVYSEGANNERYSDQYYYGFEGSYKKAKFKFRVNHDNILGKDTRIYTEVGYYRNCWGISLSVERDYNRDNGKYEWQAFLTLSIMFHPLTVYLGGS
ncbi:MAG: hypothetical protein ABGX24_03415 [Aquificota bacterium]|jgi:LPS-assembly protein